MHVAGVGDIHGNREVTERADLGHVCGKVHHKVYLEVHLEEGLDPHLEVHLEVHRDKNLAVALQQAL